MGLLYASGNTSTATNYFQAIVPGRAYPAFRPLSIFHYTRVPNTSTFEATRFNAGAAIVGYNLYFSSTPGFNAEEYDGTTDAPCGGFASSLVANKWQLWGGVYSAPNKRTLYSPTDGENGPDVTGTTVSGTGALTAIKFGTVGTTTHAIAEIAIWEAELTPEEVVKLRRGAHPTTVRPQQLFAYFPLRGDVRDHGPHGFPVFGVGTADRSTAQFTDHPQVGLPVRPRRRLLKGTAGGGGGSARRPRIIIAA